jgi:acyl carrier protein phosphodiesterase
VNTTTTASCDFRTGIHHRRLLTPSGRLNFLAHLWLADQTGTSLAGAVLGDWVRGRLPAHYPADLRLGISLHRHVDVTTDAHPVIVSLKSRFIQGQRRYAGILLDLLTDHLLAQNWVGFSAETLPQFARRGAIEIEAHASWFDEAGGYAPPAHEFERLLLSYVATAGLDRAIQRTAQRLRRPEGLIATAENWREHAQTLEPYMAGLLKDVRASAAAFVTQAASGRGP